MAIRSLTHEFRDAVVDDARGLDRDVERHGVVALRRRRLDDLHVEAHGVEVGESPVQAAARGDVGFLLLVEGSGGGIREGCQGRGRRRQMRLQEFGGAGHSHVRVHVDRDALGLDFAPWSLMRPGRCAFVLVPQAHVALRRSIAKS
jgi:hypothetical protein